MIHILSTALLLAVVGSPERTAQNRAPVAAVVYADASVRAVRADRDTVPARIGLRLAAGDEVLVPAGTRVDLLFLHDGKLERLNRSTRLPSAAAGKRITVLAAAGGDRRQAPIRPLAGAPVPISPANEVTVLGLRPSFAWFSAGPGVSYQLQIRRLGDSAYVRVAAGSDTVLHWSRTALPPLHADTAYEWAVVPDGAGRVAPFQRFRTISTDAFAAVAALLAEEPADRESAIARIAALELFGLGYEVVAELERYRARYPGPLPEAVLELEDRVRRQLGRAPGPGSIR